MQTKSNADAFKGAIFEHNANIKGWILCNYLVFVHIMPTIENCTYVSLWYVVYP